MTALPPVIRKTLQPLLAPRREPLPAGTYDPYPMHALPADSLRVGFRAVADRIREERYVRIDGYVGVFWEHFRAQLEQELAALGRVVRWYDAGAWLRSAAEVTDLTAPYLGGDDPLFGRRYPGELADFFATIPGPPELAAAELAVAYGVGAGLADWPGPLLYVDLPKNELQFRARAGCVRNLGAAAPQAPQAQYKRLYFVDWIVLNRHKKAIQERVDCFIDEQRPERPVLVEAGTVRQALDEMATSCFRVRPWFEPGPWGGQWLKRLVPELPPEAPNYAWSFELITPENGLLFGDGREIVELSFDWLMYRNGAQVLGDSATRFGDEFPIRFDYLDTWDGGNLSVQCHPTPDYIQREFGESFTQDECYYLVECGADAGVFLGFQEGIDPQAFRVALEQGVATGDPVDVERFVQRLPARQHGLYLIPHGTVHCSGKDCVVLEISATPYIFTFKMYDWQRLDLEGKPRPLNIERAFQNLDFSRAGACVPRELVSALAEIGAGPGWRLFHLPTHPRHFYDVHRVELQPGAAAELAANGSPSVMMLVAGATVRCETSGRSRVYSFGETFVTPAAASQFRLINESAELALVVRAFVKPTKSKPTPAGR